MAAKGAPAVTGAVTAGATHEAASPCERLNVQRRILPHGGVDLRVSLQGASRPYGCARKLRPAGQRPDTRAHGDEDPGADNQKSWRVAAADRAATRGR